MPPGELNSIENFVDVAQRFFELFRRRKRLQAQGLIERLYPLLLELGKTAALLPKYADAAQVDFPRDDSDYYEALVTQLGTLNLYWEVFHPYDKSPAPEAIRGSLADDLCDIYWDIGPGIGAWSKSSAETRRGIVWHWRFSYFNHWGHHLIDATRAIHSVLNE